MSRINHAKLNKARASVTGNLAEREVAGEKSRRERTKGFNRARHGYTFDDNRLAIIRRLKAYRGKNPFLTSLQAWFKRDVLTDRQVHAAKSALDKDNA